jgi:hypothetical protein
MFYVDVDVDVDSTHRSRERRGDRHGKETDMTTEPRPLTAKTSIGAWLQHPEGGPLIRELLGRGGFDETALAPVRELPLRQLVALSQGQLPQAVVDDLVARANGAVALRRTPRRARRGRSGSCRAGSMAAQ